MTKLANKFLERINEDCGSAADQALDVIKDQKTEFWVFDGEAGNKVAGPYDSEAEIPVEYKDSNEYQIGSKVLECDESKQVSLTHYQSQDRDGDWYAVIEADGKAIGKTSPTRKTQREAKMDAEAFCDRHKWKWTIEESNKGVSKARDFINRIDSSIRPNINESNVVGITITQCGQVVAAALAKAVELDLMMNIAVVDASGRLKQFIRMDGAWIGSIDISISKAFTALSFSGDMDAQGPLDTKSLGELAQDGKPLNGIQVTNKDDGVVIFAGGIPLYEGNTLIGAIGVSGSTVENDQLVAEAGAKVL